MNAKILFFSLVFISNIQAGYSQVTDPDEDIEKFDKNYLQFFNRVKSIKVYERSNIYTPKKNIEKVKNKLVEEKLFNTSGKIILLKLYNDNPNAQFIYSFKYDSLMLKTCIKFNGANTKEYLWNFINDTLVSEEIRFLPNGKIKYRWKYNYDDNYNLISMTKFVGNDRQERKLIQEFDTLDRLISYHFFKPVDKEKYSGIVEYEDTTTRVTNTSFYKNTHLLEKNTMDYDSAGNLICEYNWDNHSDKIKKLVYHYDSLGHVSEINAYTNNKMEYNISKTYDENGRVISTVYKSHDIIIGREEYEYDGFGNIRFYKTISPLADDLGEILYFYDYNQDGYLIEQRIENQTTRGKIIKTHKYDYFNSDEIDL